MTKLSVTATGLLAVFTVGTGVGVGFLSHPAPAVAPQDPDAPPLPPPIDETPQQEPVAEEAELAANEVPTAPVPIRNPVMGTTTILMLLPEGTRVEKDQLVAELDSAALRDRLANQQIATERAKADHETARWRYQVALIHAREYAEGIFPQELKTIEGDIAIAKAELELAQVRLATARAKVQAQGDALAVKEAEVGVLRAEFNLQQAEVKKEVLLNYTHEKQDKTLQADVESARANILVRESTFNLEWEKEDLLRRSIERCKIFAPIDGIVRYVPSPNPDDPLIAEGAVVRERWLLLEIVPEEDGQ